MDGAICQIIMKNCNHQMNISRNTQLIVILVLKYVQLERFIALDENKSLATGIRHPHKGQQLIMFVHAIAFVRELNELPSYVLTE